MVKKQPQDATVGQVFSGFDNDSPRFKRSYLVGVVLAVLLLGYGGLAWAVSGTVPKGTSYAGVSVGGMSPQAAAQKLDKELAGRLGSALPVKMGQKQAVINPAEAGLRAQVKPTVDQAAAFSLNPVRVWRGLFGAGPGVIASTVDEKLLSAAVDKAAQDLKMDPVEANLICETDHFKAISPQIGAQLKKTQAIALLKANWTSAALPLTLPQETKEPQSTKKQLDQALAGPANAIVSGPLQVKIGDKETNLQVATLCENTRFKLGKDGLEPQFDGEKLRETILQQLPGVEKDPVDARLSFASGTPTVVPAQDGAKLEAAQVAAKVAAGATTTDHRQVGIDLKPIVPAVTTQDANGLGINQKISEFSTPYPSIVGRNENLALGAKRITGVILKPGETFSLEKTLGPIQPGHGWHAAGVINNGFHTDALGGGLSQVSTTTFNAAYFAGMDIVEFTPHTQYITRYPEGREATLWEGSIDMKFKNSAPTAVALNAFVGGGRITVQVWGTPYWEVKSHTGPRYGIVAPRSVVSHSPHCEPQAAGQPGFSVKFTRERWLNGAKHDEKTWTTTYEAVDAITCG